MTAEVVLLISGISLAFALYSIIANMKRNHKADVKADAANENKRKDEKK